MGEDLYGVHDFGYFFHIQCAVWQFRVHIYLPKLGLTLVQGICVADKINMLFGYQDHCHIHNLRRNPIKVVWVYLQDNL